MNLARPTERISIVGWALAKLKSKFTVQSRQSGLSIEADTGTITDQNCLNIAQSENWRRMGLDQNLPCGKLSIAQNGQCVSIDVHCCQPKTASLHSEIEFSANREQYRFDHFIHADGTAMRLKGQTRRLGDCP